MKEYVIRLLPLSSLEGAISSDTLFGALCWAIRTLYGQPRLEQMLAAFHDEPAFLVSSAFPCRIQDGQTTYFLPRPKYPPLKSDALREIAETDYGITHKREYNSSKVAQVAIAEKYKRFQKVEWIDAEIFRTLASKGTDGERILFLEYVRNRLLLSFRKNELGVQKNTIDRLLGSTGGEGNTFYNLESFVPQYFALYFLIRTDNFPFLEPPFRLLEDSGIGPNARTGKNRFRVRWEERDLTPGGKKSSFVTLSRTIPNDDMDSRRSFYEIAPVRSKVESREEFAGEDVWKDAVIYLREGSIITPHKPALHFGGVFPAKVLRGKKIYQYGLAYPFWGNFCEEDF